MKQQQSSTTMIAMATTRIPPITPPNISAAKMSVPRLTVGEVCVCVCVHGTGSRRAAQGKW